MLTEYNNFYRHVHYYRCVNAFFLAGSFTALESFTCVVQDHHTLDEVDQVELRVEIEE
jgi:hypothetical protein